MSINIIFLNVRGLKDTIKRRSIFNYYRKCANVICLQETHSESVMEGIWKSEWGGKIFFSHGLSNSRGVCILIGNELPYQVVQSLSDSEGRLVIVELECIDNPCKRLTICNLYGPNKDSPAFFTQAMTLVSKCSSELILIGDFNFVQDPNIDRRGSSNNFQNACTTVEEIKDEFSLIDIWRIRNPESLVYSWMRTKPKYIASRLDYALVSQGVSGFVQNTMYLPGIHTDHLAFYLSVNINSSERGKGYWKFNNQLLKNTSFVQEMNTIIETSISRSVHMDPHDKWCFIKKNMSDFAKDFAKNVSSERDLIISQLSEKLMELEHELPTNPQLADLVVNTKADLEEKQFEKTKSIIFRTKANWQELGEKLTKYFLNMEKRRYSARVCNKIIKEGNTEVTEPKSILQEQRRFYQELYKSDPNIEFNVNNSFWYTCRYSNKKAV